ncbi:MAG: hypothetical protein LBI13_03760 [Streptococcaceae bacterium]|jgi:hypothetical protein|nr:hypothetical protein [Streptococcaceae bacterium]
MLDWLEEQAKNYARATMGAIVEVSVKKDYFFSKSSAQTAINVSNGIRGINLTNVQSKVKDGLQGKTGEVAIRKVEEFQNNSYYNDGADSITW